MNNRALPRVLIGAPIHQVKKYCIGAYIKNTLNIDYENFDVYLVDNSLSKIFSKNLRQAYPQIDVDRLPYTSKNYDCRGAIHRRVVASCNMIRDRVLNGGYDYLLSLECDVIIPPNGLRKLVSDDKLFVSGLPYLGFYPSSYWEEEDLVIETRGTLGCALISRELLEKFPFRYDVELLAAFHDALLLHDIHQGGYDFWVDKSVRCEHLSIDPGGANRGWDELPASERES